MSVVETHTEHPATATAGPQRWRRLGLAGATLLAVGGTGASVLPRPDPLDDLPVLRLLRGGSGPWICAAVAMLGMAVLVVAWWQLRDDERGDVRWLTVTAAVWALPLAVAPPLFSRDVYSYAAQGTLLAHGLDPYEHGVVAIDSPWNGSVSPAWLHTPAPYGPLFLWLARWVVELSGGHLIAAVLLFRLTAVAGVVLVAVFVPRLAAACGVDARRAQWLALVNPLLLAHFVAGAHNDALMVGLMVAALACAAGRRTAVAAVLVGLAAAVKVPAVVALPFVAVLWAARRPGRWALWRACLASAALAVAAFVAASLLAGLGPGWVGALRGSGASVQWTSIPTGDGIALGWVVSGLGQPAWRDEALAGARVAGTLLAVVVLVALWWQVRHHSADTRRVVAACGAGLAAVVVLAPAFHPWYALWAVVVLAASTVGRRAVTGLVVATAALSFLVLPDGYNLARVTLVPGVVVDVALTGAAAILGLRWLGRRRARHRAATPARP